MSSAIYVIPETKKAQETFYPTPPELAKRMISLVKWSDVESVAVCLLGAERAAQLP